jgi:hypothetical protein
MVRFMPGTGESVRSSSLAKDVAVGVPAGGCDGLIQQEPRSGIGAALHDKHRRAARQPSTPHTPAAAVPDKVLQD